MRGTPLIALALVLAACATREGYEARLNQLIGQPADQLIQLWGPPERDYPLQNGNKVLSWRRSRTETTGGAVTYQDVVTTESGTTSAGTTYEGRKVSQVPVVTPVQSREVECRTNLTVDPAGIIRAWSFEGEDCVAVPPQ